MKMNISLIIFSLRVAPVSPAPGETSQLQHCDDCHDIGAAGERLELSTRLLLVEFARLRAPDACLGLGRLPETLREASGKVKGWIFVELT